MKNQIRNGVILPKISYLLYFSFTIIFYSCAKDKQIGEEIAKDDRTTIAVNIVGIEEGSLITSSKLKATAGEAKNNTVVVGGISSDPAGFDTRVSVGEFEELTNSTTVSSKKRTMGMGGALRAEKMEIGIYYHLLLYKESDNTIAFNGQLTAGTSFNITVDGGVNYKWIAFSYNTDEASALPPVAGLADAVVPMGNNRDFLYASGTITPVALVNTPLGIFFQHKTARIAVELDTRGMFAPIVEATVAIDGQLKTGNFDLSTGLRTGVSSAVPINASSSSVFTRASGYGYDDRKVAYFYTVDPTVLPNLTVTLKNVTIGLDAHAVSENILTRVFSGLSSTFSVANFTPVLEQSKLFKIDLIESPITTVCNGGNLTTKWARANLYYLGALDHNPFRFHHLN